MSENAATAGGLTTTQPRLLVVDDNASFRRAVSLALSDHYDVTYARSGAEARRKLRNARPDAILLELMLPDIDGLLLMIGLHAKTDAVIVVCTERDDPVDRVVSRRLGAVDFIAKPVDFRELEVRLANALSGRTS
jgi:DNA-binding response OmpR family regulator